MGEAPPSKFQKEEKASAKEAEEAPANGAALAKNYGVNELSDVCLVVGNMEFNVHKMILSNRSKYFQTLFFGNFKEKNQERIEIVDVDPRAFERMLDVIYDMKFKDTHFFTCGEKTKNSSKEFWKQVGNLWTALDRFDVPHGRTRFLEDFNENWCKPVDGLYKCPFCVNRFVFCHVNVLEMKDINKSSHFSHRATSDWVEKHFDGVPKTIASDVVKKLRKSSK